MQPRPPLDGAKFCRFQVLPSPLGSSSGWKSPFPYITSVWKLSVNSFTVLPIGWIVCYNIPTFTYIYYRNIWVYLVKEKPPIRNEEPLKKYHETTIQMQWFQDNSASFKDETQFWDIQYFPGLCMISLRFSGVHICLSSNGFDDSGSLLSRNSEVASKRFNDVSHLQLEESKHVEKQHFPCSSLAISHGQRYSRTFPQFLLTVQIFTLIMRNVNTFETLKWTKNATWHESISGHC